MSSELAETYARIFEPLSQHAPGSEASTLRAFDAVPALGQDARVLDVGCGPGRHSRTIAARLDGRVVAVDLARGVLQRIAAEGATNIDLVCGDMARLPFAEQSFDLIWCEGAIYSIGFRNALERFRPLLRDAGTLAATELVWLRDDRPERLVSFWREEYPDMASCEERREEVAAEGYELSLEFALPESDWWDIYYAELEGRLRELEGQDMGSGQAVVDMCRREIDIMREADGAYGYVFYVMRKT